MVLKTSKGLSFLVNVPWIEFVFPKSSSFDNIVDGCLYSPVTLSSGSVIDPSIILNWLPLLLVCNLVLVLDFSLIETPSKKAAAPKFPLDEIAKSFNSICGFVSDASKLVCIIVEYLFHELNWV